MRMCWRPPLQLHLRACLQRAPFQPFTTFPHLQAYANELANAQSDQDLASQVVHLLAKEGITAPGAGTVMIGHDTRPSGPGLAAAAAAGVRCLGLEAQMCGLLTTPQLHWMVMSRNRGEPCEEEDYYAALAGAYKQLVAGTQPLGQVHGRCWEGNGIREACGCRHTAWRRWVPPPPMHSEMLAVDMEWARRACHFQPAKRLACLAHGLRWHLSMPGLFSACSAARCPPQTLYMDCANGVGAAKMRALAAHLADAGLAVDLRNTGEGVLNGGCGSDFLQKDRQLPAGFGGVAPGARCCAVDGDADRLMYFTPLAGGSQGGWLGRALAGWGEPAGRL